MRRRIATALVVCGLPVLALMGWGLRQQDSLWGNTERPLEAAGEKPNRLTPSPAEGGHASTWPEAARLVERALAESHPTSTTVHVLRQSLTNRELAPFIRNNAANALLSATTPPADLHRTFVKIIHDPKEDLRWRQYSVQYLAFCYPTSEAPQTIQSELREIARSPEPMLATQAVVMLHYLDRDGHVAMRPDMDASLVGALVDENLDERTRMSALSLVGQRKTKEALPTVRQLAEEESSMQRVAIATLGLLGDQADIPLIRRHLKSPQPLVRIAAEKALKRLETAVE